LQKEFSKNQNAYRKNKSSSHSVIRAVQGAQTALNEKKSTVLVAMDFESCF